MANHNWLLPFYGFAMLLSLWIPAIKWKKNDKTNKNLLAQLNKRRQLLLHMLGSKTHKCNFSNTIQIIPRSLHSMQQYWQTYWQQYVTCNNVLKHQYGCTLKYRHCRWEAENIYRSQRRTIKATRYQHRKSETETAVLYISLVANKHPMSQYNGRSQRPLPLCIQKKAACNSKRE